ncbi:hypothetical protein EJ04DRAFT_573957 [Polyplosphaeria fusca]|uniref:Uncharacterized protein n=1 Tax=Polyplosphaeria fusca TaxID=682080 RepID=A0A9P4R869_9PLEO|nr:hypothetical protein EJ04DRAFT_573957 [Polyplosphaeria fusca]
MYLLGHFFIITTFLLQSVLSVDPNQVPDFQILYDSPQDTDKTLHRFSSKLTFIDLPNNDVWRDVCGFDERKLSQIAKDAYWQMMNKFLESPTSDIVKWWQRPHVMTALTLGNEVYLSSSLKGGPFVYFANDPENPVYKELNECQLRLTRDNPDVEEGTKHQKDASCGEIMALYSYFTEYSGDRAKERLKDTRVVTVKNSKRWGPKNSNTPLKYEDIQRFDPCGSDQRPEVRGSALQKEFGCYQATYDRFEIKPILEIKDAGDQEQRTEAEFGDPHYSNFKFETTHVSISCRRPADESTNKRRSLTEL